MKFKNGVSVDKISGYYRRDWQMPILEKAGFRCIECGNGKPCVFKMGTSFASLCKRCYYSTHCFHTTERNQDIFEAFKTEGIAVIAKRCGISHQRIHQIVMKENKKHGFDFTESTQKRKKESLKNAWIKNANKFKHSWGPIEYRA